MPTAEETRITDAAELQTVLTRYVDSYDGYQQAAAVVENQGLRAAFLEIAERRKTIVEHVATLITRQGEKPDVEGSPEAAVHRWWIRVRATMTDEEFKATLAECVRGETVLANTIQSALDHGHLDSTHAAILSEVSEELKAALLTFETALER
ncbi:MAG: PA2169 family four-helix-bundle protein [Luteolibacter sp.]